jgi:tryptophan 7-halogenase
MTQTVVVVGGGTAGCIAAISLLRELHETSVTVVRSSALGHIMVGEGTFAQTPEHLHGVLGIPRQTFYERVNPTLKLGLRLEWGPRPYFDFPFAEEYDSQVLPSAEKPWGYYHVHRWEGSPVLAQIDDPVGIRPGYHVENHAFVEFLERYFLDLGGGLVDAKVTSVEVGSAGVEAITLDSGERRTADLFVDASGFRAELIHKALGEPYVSMRDHLFCDRAVVGGWAREEEPIKPYTTAETMDAGWAWQIEHERIINRGYVFSSAFLSDDDAADELRRKNPKLGDGDLRAVPFASRRVRRAWVGNVAAIGNACGFVEPLEATNIQVICLQAQRLARSLGAGRGGNAREHYNQFVEAQWDDIRDFLALHYRFNVRVDSPFWRMAVNDTPLGGLEEYVERYRAVGPTLMTERSSMFGRDGALALLLGMRVPWRSCAVW